MHPARRPLPLPLAGLMALLLAGPVSAADTFTPPEGAHIAFVGNTLADRMQHDGWLEAYLQARFPDRKLVVRDLGFAGDEVNFRQRSANFGSPDEWLARVKADVVFACFGYNESFAGSEGLEKFRKELDGYVKHLLAQKYNGKSPPQVVLFSPTAAEDLKTPDLPPAALHNARLEPYARAVAEVAAANKVGFVDLFGPTRAAFARADKPLTINGIHFNERGNRMLAEITDEALLAAGKPRPEEARLEAIRRAVLDKNFHWFNRYRTTDGYSIFGGRADLSFVGGQTNRVVMQREMEILDAMTANLDPVIWAAAQGKEAKADDSRLPEFIPVTTNRPGAGPNGAHLFLSGEDAIGKMKVAQGFKVTLFASEEKFPELANPVQMAFDTRGRLWVAAWPSYPHWKPGDAMNDKLLILEDTDGDGKADVCKTFADKLHNPTGFEFANGGVYVAMAPDLLFLKDTNGDDKADVRERVISGLDSADTHHTANSFTLDPGGALYFQEGTFHHTQVETPYGPTERVANGAVFRYEPKAQKFEVYVSHGFANPHGHAFDRWGQDIVVDGTGAQPYQAGLFSGHVDFPNKHQTPPQVYRQRTRPCPGIEYLSSRHFPDNMQGHLLVPNVIGFQGILEYAIEDKGAGLVGTEVRELLSSSDPNFRPADLEVGPDGALYFTDWQNPIIGHMQHNLRDPSRDQKHGRVYRVTAAGRELLKPVPVAGQPVEKLLDLLKSPEDRVRYRAKIELGGRNREEVIAAAKKWLAGLDPKDKEFEHHRLEGLWLHQHQNVVDADLLKAVLASPDYRARAAATRVLCYQRDRVPDALEWLKRLAADENPRVRLEAVRAASFFRDAEAVEVPLISAERPTDLYLDFIRGETMRTLDPYVKKALAAGKPINLTSDAGARYFLAGLTTEQLLKMKRTRGVDVELLFRKGVRDEDRRSALADLAKLDGKPEAVVLVDTLRKQDELPGTRDESVVADLVRLLAARPPAELTAARGPLEGLATGAKLPLTRQLGFAALIAADGNADKAWALAGKSLGGLRDLVEAVPLVRDPDVKAALYPKIAALLEGLPKELTAGLPPAGKAAVGRFVRVELPGGTRTLTLAEVEVISDGRNVAREGKASQSSTAFGGDASRGIDGNKSATYAEGGQTHTAENKTDPWWEVDLGRDVPVTAIIVYNRADGDLGQRLNGYTLKVLDADRKTVFEKANLPAPTPSATIEVGGTDPVSAVRHAAMLALTSVRGQEANTFRAVAKYIGDENDRAAAVRALQRIPVRDWPADQAGPLTEAVLTFARKVPAGDRTRTDVVEALQLGESLAGLLPADRARQVRKQLSELGVRVLRVGTVFEQMRYDRERLAVQAGKPVEFALENTDLMPHNFVIVRPGALEEVGKAAEAFATQPDAAGRQYVPPSDKVLVASKLLQTRETQRLPFVAPKEPGVYPYVCTYPGHWSRMHGALYVVADLDEYLADPEGYLAKNPLTIKDDLLKFNRPRKEWKFEELVGSVESLKEGRSFANGKQLFQAASCAACHKVNGIGNEIGPDLTKLDPKYKPADVLKSLLEPSEKIDEKYRSWVIQLSSGKTVTGMILEEKDGVIKVVENPLAAAKPVEIKLTEIEERTKSATSIMPKGLLDKLTHDEILDLMAYLLSRGDAKHALYSGHEHHGH